MLEAANAYYSFTLGTGFWEWLASQIRRGMVLTVGMVRAEIDAPQELVDWITERVDDGFLIDVSDRPIQSAYSDMAAWIINQSFGPEHIAKFLDGADLWIIAAAKAIGASVVSQEKVAGPGTKKIKIPDVCRQFNIPCMTTFELLRDRDAHFS